jgi:hypothetical protein
VINQRQARDEDGVRGMGAMLIAGIALTGALFVANLLLGDVNQDEGWYLYAARLVSQGRLPYVDFASTQGPVMPFVYAAAMPLVDRWGVAGGRVFTALLGLLATAGSVVLSARLTPRPWRTAAAALALAFAGVNVYQTYFLAVVKTYALTAALLTGGYLLLSSARGRGGAARAFAAGALMALAAGTRLSAAFALPAPFLWLAWQARRRDAGAGGGVDLRWLAFGGGAALTAAAVFGPFAFTAPRALWFALVEYHTGREVGGVAARLAYKAGFVSRCVAAYGAAAAAAAAAALYAWLQPGGRKNGGPATGAEPGFEGAVWGSVGLVTVIHALAPFPYDDYQVFVYPLLAAALAARVVRLAAAGGGRRVQWAVGAAGAACVLAAGASPMAWQWAIGERDRIWWPLREQSPLARLQEAGRWVREAADERGGGGLLTQDTYLAVEAGLAVPEGMELGPFCYFPDWTDEKARACHVLNRKLMAQALAQSDAPVAAFSGYGLAIRCPEVTALPPEEQAALWAAVRQRYTEAREVDHFGQASTKLVILTPK